MRPMPRPSAAPLPPADLRRVAVAAYCDPRTVAAYLAGRSQASTTIARVEAALAAEGRSDLVRRPTKNTAAA